MAVGKRWMSQKKLAPPPSVSANAARIKKIILVEDDDGTASLDKLPGVTQQEIFQAALIITDRGRILKSRDGPPNIQVASYDLVRKQPEKKTTQYRSIFDPVEIQADE